MRAFTPVCASPPGRDATVLADTAADWLVEADSIGELADAGVVAAGDVVVSVVVEFVAVGVEDCELDGDGVGDAELPVPDPLAKVLSVVAWTGAGIPSRVTVPEF